MSTRLDDVNIGKKLVLFLSLLILFFAGISLYIVKTMRDINDRGYEVGTQWLPALNLLEP